MENLLEHTCFIPKDKEKAFPKDKNICKRYGIQVHFKSDKTIKEELVALKDQDHITKKEWYHLQIPM